MKKLFNYTNPTNFFEQNSIDVGPFSNTSLTSHKETQEKYAQRFIPHINKENEERFKNICDKLFRIQYPCSMKPSYASLPDTNNNIPSALYIPYAENKSLKMIIQRLEKGEIIENFDVTQTLIIIYGILLFLDAMHKDNELHGRLKISNILLDSQFYPLVSDSFLYDLNKDGPINESNIKMIDYIVSLPPEVIHNNKYTPKSDIYSFGIIILQILTHQINVYSDITDNSLEILKLKQIGQLPNIPEIENKQLHDLICSCLEFDPDNRPNAHEMMEIIEQMGTDEHRYDLQRLQKFKSINNSTDEIQNPKIREMKRLADGGDIKMMYEYGRLRFIGEEDCPSDLTEAIKYINKAALEGHNGAQSLLQTLHNEFSQKFDTQKPEIHKEAEPGPATSPKSQKNNKLHLKDDPFFTRTKADIKKIIEKVKQNYKIQKIRDFQQVKLAKKGFIFTEGANKRLTKLYNYLESGVPVLLEGPTGTSKTLSSEIVCQLRGQPLLRFNLSSETKASYLLGRYKGDIDSWAGISMTYGPFIDAYKNGCTLLLDEINLASPECLQFIEEALDSGKISIEIPGMPLKEIKMDPKFRLIATQNPNKGLFANKRHDLDTKFLSRFQVINFPAFDEDEYKKIAEGLAKSFNYDASDQFIIDLVDFHMKWSSRKDVKGDVQCFTVREIAATVHALSEKRNVYDTIMTIYGARYSREKKDELKSLFLSYNSFKKLKPEKFTYPPNFPVCFHNKNLEEALKAIFFSFDNKRNVILTGMEGSGITQLAKWVAKYYDSINTNNDDQNISDTEFFCVCTEETKCSDLIGRQKPSDNIESGQELITFKQGLLTEAIQQGKCVVLDSLDEAPSTVTERLNGLLDEKYDGEKKMFEIPENPQGKPIEINPKFRLICTCRLDKMNQMSPAFVNRFDVIVLDNQLKDISDSDLEALITLLMKIKIISSSQNVNDSNDNAYNNKTDKIDDNKNDDDQEQFEEDGDDEELVWEIDDDDDNNTTEANVTQQETSQTQNADSSVNIIEFNPSKNLVELVLKSFDRSSTMFKLSQLCKAVSKFVHFFSNNLPEGSSKIENEKIVTFTTNFLTKTEDFTIPKEIEDFFIHQLSQANVNDDGQYFFQDSPSLRSFMAKLYAASIINLPLCVYGPTGVGKTSAARAFARMRTNQQKRNIPFLMHSFHAGTKPNHFYGTTTIKNGRIVFINGTLTTAIQKGFTFIADEMNLSTISTMKSLAPALEPCIGEKIFIPGVGETATISPNFFFIACQNELGTIGRNVIPSSIASRFRILYYPVQQEDDISAICNDIAQSFYNNTKISKSFTSEDAQKIGKYMIKLNHEKQKIIPQWSLRDITKLFRRIRFQDENSSNYHNLTFYHNVLFYTLAPVSKSERKGIFDTILKLIGDTFILDSNLRNKLKKCYENETSIQNIPGKGSFLMKGDHKNNFENDVGISTDLFNNFKEYVEEFSGLPSLLDSIFQILLSDKTEPILLMGPSGFKTFLSKIYLENSKVVALTQETTVSQLIGSSAFLTNSEAKHFYLDLICKICHIYDSKTITSLKDKLSDRSLTKNDITSKTRLYLPSIPSFSTAVTQLTDKLFDDTLTESSQNVLSDMIIEFRPGLFLLPILQGQSLILKNLSNLPTIVLERFNELFSGKHSLTLNEDFHNTFTSSEQKEISNFDFNFRAFATCPPNTAAKLSEAVLSRFTVINTPEYKNDEQGNVLKSYNIINDKKLPSEIIDLIIRFANSVQNHLRKTISFTQMINILEICSRLIEKTSSISPLNILGIVLYRIFVGLLERRNEYNEKIKTIFSEINVPFPFHFMNPISESPFIITSKDGFQGLESKITGLFIHSTDVNDPKLNVAFTPSFVEMLDIIHLGILTKTPVILEGNAGQGKQKAIEYVARNLGYEIVNIVISKSTKVDDLLGKVTIEPDEKNKIHVKTNLTKLAKAIESNSKISNSIFVFHNLNNASPAVLEKLSSLFDRAQNEFSLPDGTMSPKGEINVIGIFNPQNGISNRDKLPTSLIYSSIYHIVENPKKQDVLKIIEVLFQPTEFKYDVLNFFEKYKSTKKIALQYNASAAVTLYDINKYILFRNVTNGYFKEEMVSQMLFIYRFLQQDAINKALEDTGLKQMVFEPKFIFNEDKKEIYIKESDDSEGLTLKIHNEKPMETEKIQLSLRTLTVAQQQCLLFLACSVLSKRACIVQGSTASGKSHIIRLFADMLGKKLNVYQMNSETGMSILTGQSVLLNEISEKDSTEFQIAFSDLQSFDELKSFINKNFSIPYKDWKPKQFSELLKLIDKYIQDHEKSLSEEEMKLLNRAEIKIKQTMSPAKRFHHEKSTFIRALEKGEWVLIDGIESAPSEIAEKFSSLCGDDPEIDLFECGENNFFSRNKPNSRRISDNFQLFVTYNPSSKIGSKTLDSNFLNKCISFTLPSIDATPNSSAQLLIGSLMNYKYENDFAINIGKRFANTHQYAKKDSEDDRDSYAGDTQFTGRTLTFILKEFNRNIKDNGNSTDDIDKVICRSLQSYYWNSYTNKDKEDDIKLKMINELSKEPELKDFKINNQGIDPKEKYESLLIDLRNIQLFVCSNDENKKLDFDFKKFIKKCINVQLKDISFIFDHLYDTLKIIKQYCPISEPRNWQIYQKEYSQIQIILNLFKCIKNEMHTLNPQYLSFYLYSNDLLSINNFKKPISNILLLDELNNNLCQSLPYLLYDEYLVNLIKLISEMAQDPSMAQFNKFISQINEKNELIPKIAELFPFHFFQNKQHPFHYLLYWIPMITKLYNQKITFHIECHHTYDFVFSTDYSGIEPTYIFKEENSLCLSTGSKLFFPAEGKTLPIPPKASRESWSKAFYGLTNLLCDDNQIKSFQAFKAPDKLKKFQKSLPPKKTNHFPCLSKLYMKHLDDSLISKAWSIVYNFPSEIIQILTSILHPLESDIIKVVSYYYNTIEIDQFHHVFEFNKWASQIGKQQSKLWMILNNQYEFKPGNNTENTKNERDQIIREMNYLKISPIIQNLWSPTKFIDRLQNAKIPLDAAIKKTDDENKENSVRQKLKDLIDKLEKTNIKNKEYLALKNEIIHNIILISEKSPKDDDFKRCEQKVQQFLDCLSNEIDQSSNNIILWPNYVPPTKFVYKETSKIKLYQHIIWFSQVKALIDRICDPNNMRVFEDTFELNKFPEMQSSAHLLMKQLMDIQETDKFEINPINKDSIYSTLNAQFIMKLNGDKLLSNIKFLDNIFNDLSNRKEIKDESEIQWIHQKTNQYHPNLNIILPEFNPCDLFYLLVGYSGDVKNLDKGPLISNINCKNLLENIGLILFSNPCTFVECADKIAYTIFRIVFKDKTIPTNHSEYKLQFEDELKKSRARKNIYKSNKESHVNSNKESDEYLNKLRDETLMNAAISILNISDNLVPVASPFKYKFVNNDVAFLNPDWIKDSDFISKYPSFVYWLIKYQKYASTLVNIYSGTAFNEKSIPFWLFALRIMSSQNCIILDIDSSTTVSKIITETMNKFIKSFIKSKGLSNLGTDWLSLVLSSVPSEILVPNYRMFYDFFTYLSKDNKMNTKDVDDQKKLSITAFTENVCEMVFKNTANDFLEKQFGDLSDNNLAFIYNPNDFINQQIKLFIKQQFLDFRNSEDFKKMKDNSLKIELKLENIIKTLSEKIQKENHAKETRFIQSQREMKISKLNKMKNDMKKNIDSYNEKITIMKTAEVKEMSRFSSSINELIKLHNLLPDLIEIPNEPLIVYHPEWPDQSSLKLLFKGKKSSSIDLMLQKKNEYYFPKSVTEKVKNVKYLYYDRKYEKLTWNEVKFQYINIEQNNIDEICAKKMDYYTINERVPTLIFGVRNQIQQEEFIQKLNKTKNIFSLLIKDVEKDIKNEKITDASLSKSRNIISDFTNISSLLTVRFTDNEECQIVQNILNELKSIYSQLERYAYNFESLLKRKIYDFYKSYSNMSYAQKMFTFQYKLPFPSQETINTSMYNINFDPVINAEFLSLPILSVEKNEENEDVIQCCFDSLECSIGPIIPNLYSGKCAMNFISFIDTPISIEIQTDSHQELFPSKSVIQPGEPCQIFIELPANSSNEMTEISFEAKIIIKSTNTSIKHKELPCNFTFKLVPLSILISCDEFPLSYSNNEFYVCAPKINPDSQLTFSFKNFYINNDVCKVAHQLVDFDDNEAEKPELNYNQAKNKLTLQIKDTEEVTKLHFTLAVKFSESLIIKILIDSVIIPFEFSFDLYDYEKKQYVSDNSTIYYSSMYLDREIVLHCRLYGMFFSEMIATIKNNFSYPITTVSSPANLYIQEDKEFDIIIKVKDVISSTTSHTTYYSGSYYTTYSNNYSYFVSVKIGEIEKKIYLKFDEPKIMSTYGTYLNSSYFDMSCVYGYNWKEKEWKLLNSNNYYSTDLVYIVSPFHFVDKFSAQNTENVLKITVPKIKNEIHYLNAFKVSSSKTIEVLNVYYNEFISMNERGECFSDRNNKLEFKLIYSQATTLIGIAENEWYPIFDDYDGYFELFSNLEINEENIEYAKEKISRIPNPTFCSPMSFIQFTRLIHNVAVLKNLRIFVNKFPQSFQDNEFIDVLNYLMDRLSSIDDHDIFIPIIEYNIIYIFYNLFKKRQTEIQNNGGYLFKRMSQTEIKQKVQECYENYAQVDEFATSKDSFNESQRKLKKIKKGLNNIEIHPQPSDKEQFESYLVTVDSEPKPHPMDELPDQIEHSISQNTFSTNKTININLPQINIPSKSEFKTFSIQSLNKFYQICTDGTRLLPIYVKNMLIQDSFEMKKAAKEYFFKLLQIYKPLPNKDFSFISTSVNTFSLSFTTMVNKFEQAGVNFHSIVPKKFILNEQNVQGLIQYPEKDQIILSQDIWKFDKEFQTTRINGEQIIPSGNNTTNTANTTDNIVDIPTPEFIDNTNGKDKKDEKKKVDDKQHEDGENPQRLDTVKLQEYQEKMKEEYNRCKEEEEVFEKRPFDDYDEDSDDDSPLTGAGIGKESEQTIQENFDGMLSEFTEKDGIERAIARMKSINPEDTIDISPYSSLSFKSQYLKPDINVNGIDYPIVPLMNQSYIISQELIKVASEHDLPFSTMCVNILIDCSTFISDENKLFNMLCICALTDAITTFGIPYSVAVIGDKNFKCIIKPFEEQHSYIALQRICDCLHVRRYRPKLPGCIEYAIKSMVFPKETRKNRAIFTFTDGLDEHLVLTKGWSEIFTDKQLSFGFIFIKSSELIGENLTFLENVWDKFEKETNGKNCLVKVIKIIADKNIQIKKENRMEMSETIRSFVELFIQVINRTCRANESKSNIDRNYKQPLFELPDDTKLQSVNNFNQYLSKKYILKNIFVQRSDVLKDATSVIDQLDTKQFYNKLNRITTCQVDNALKKDYPIFLREYIQNRKSINRASLETIFKPNKASQTVLSSTGTDFDITALILNLINPVPDPMIYLEEKGGLIRNYGVTVVIDSSYSCFNPLSSSHSFQTIRSLLSSLASIDLPCFDLIIATNTNPIVLCSEVKTLYALNERSPIWDSLFASLQDISPNLTRVDLASAIHTAFDLRRMRSLQCTSLMFVLTDGLYQVNERPRIIECINNCVQSGMITFGIGIGIYPKGIEKLFPQYVFSGNPSNVMKGISNLFTDNFYDFSEPMFYISSTLDLNEISDAFKRIHDNSENPLFKSLCNELSRIAPTLDAFSDFINKEKDVGNAAKGFINPEGKDTELYIENFLKSQKILIVHLCDNTVCTDEQLDKKYIFENIIPGRKECINEAVKFFGITLQVVQNYEDAILEITKSKNDMCEYYAVWIICGAHPEKLPTGQRNTNKYIVEQFIDVLIKFWKNGGSLVFWADNDPFTFQVNLFLSRVRFDNSECPSGKVNFQIHGNHPGLQTLLGDETGELKQEQVFNRSPQMFEELERTTISHNLAKIYEGATLSYVENINAKTDSNYKDKIKPFRPFAIDSNGGITSLFYPSNLKITPPPGDIVIDCGFSKLFYELKEEGTYRYIQNIAGWTARPEVHLAELHITRNKGKKPCHWRPDAVNYTISNITTPNYGSDVLNLITNANNNNVTSVIKQNVQKLGGNITGVLRFSIQWNDLGYWDNNDLDAHCITPNGFEIMYDKKVDNTTGGNLDIDYTSTTQGKPVCENITWPTLSKMRNGTYRFFVHQYNYRNGHSGFRAEIEFENRIYSYDYRQTLPNKSSVDVAYVTLSNGRFSIRHCLSYH